MVNAQEYINEKYSNKQEVKKITEQVKGLAGKLTIVDFPQLESAAVGKNQLTQLHLKIAHN